MKHLIKLVLGIAALSFICGCGSYRENVKAWSAAGAAYGSAALPAEIIEGAAVLFTANSILSAGQSELDQ